MLTATESETTSGSRKRVWEFHPIPLFSGTSRRVFGRRTRRCHKSRSSIFCLFIIIMSIYNKSILKLMGLTFIIVETHCVPLLNLGFFYTNFLCSFFGRAINCPRRSTSPAYIMQDWHVGHHDLQGFLEYNMTGWTLCGKINPDTDIFGGISSWIWTWSGHTSLSKRRTPFHSHNRRKFFPTSVRFSW